MARKKVGVFLNQVDGGYQGRIWPGLHEAAKALDVDLFILAGQKPGEIYNNFYQHELVYHFADKDSFDGLIIVSPSLSKTHGEDFEDFIEQFSHIPLVSISHKIGNYPVIESDNTAGVINAIKHLALDHGYQNIGFMKGIKGHIDSDSRYKAYMEALSDLGREFNPDMVAYGHFTQPGGAEAINELLSRGIKLDAIFCANDEMAFGAINELKLRGLKVPDDIAIVGFDDIYECVLQYPSISTVAQPLYQMGYRCVEILVDMLEGREVESYEEVPTRFINRTSCGCNTQITDDILNNYNQMPLNIKEDHFEKTIAHIFSKSKFNKEIQHKLTKAALEISQEPLELKRYQDFSEALYWSLDEGILGLNDVDIINLVVTQVRNKINAEHPELDLKKLEVLFAYLRASVGDASTTKNNFIAYKFNVKIYLLRGLTAELYNAVNVSSMKKVLINHVSEAMADVFYVCLYAREMRHKMGAKWKLPKKSQVIYGFKDGQSLDVKNIPLFDTEELLPKELENVNRYTYVVKPLFFGEIHFGYMCINIRLYENDTFYESLREIISGVLWSALLYEKYEKSQEQLQNSNARLEKLSISDEMTGLRNRRGFLNLAEQQYKVCKRSGRDFAIAYVDIDGLKLINDTYGHKAGDIAIKGMAEVLVKTFRDSDIISRHGGDEFVVMLTTLETPLDIAHFTDRLNQNFELYNEKSGLPYELTASIGFAVFDPIDNPSDIEELMNQADAQLYMNKAARKKHN